MRKAELYKNQIQIAEQQESKYEGQDPAQVKALLSFVVFNNNGTLNILGLSS